MPHIIEYEKNGLGAVITFSGTIEQNEIGEIQLMNQLNGFSKRWHYHILDFSCAEKVNMSIDQIRQFVIEENEFTIKNLDRKLAIIPSKIAYKGIDRLFQIFESVWGAWNSKTFGDIDSARNWAQNDQPEDI